jgi:hypothetical protein
MLLSCAISYRNSCGIAAAADIDHHGIVPGIFIHQILNHYTQPADLDPGFLVLDNSANERPDWFEYWPIRKFLLNEPLDEASFYGFLSPKFKAKTNLSAAAVHEFVARDSGSTDVVLLSPSLHLTAYHSNVFAYGEKAHPGLLEVADRFFRHIGEPTDLDSLVTTSCNEVYSNFFIGKPRFWRAWLGVTEQLFALAESADEPLGSELRRPTLYRGGRGVQMKIFIMERIATWLLARDRGFVARARDPFAARSRIYKLPAAVACDALKVAYLTIGREQYMDVFHLLGRIGRVLSWQIRLGAFFRLRPLRSCVDSLSTYWVKAGRS